MRLPRLHSFIQRHIVAPVPDAMNLCLSCNQVDCSAEEYDACGPRLARAERLRRERDATVQPPSNASASSTTLRSAPGAKGELSPAEATSSVKGAEPPRPHSAM
jgi:hypothetical protein